MIPFEQERKQREVLLKRHRSTGRLQAFGFADVSELRGYQLLLHLTREIAEKALDAEKPVVERGSELQLGENPIR
jgi:hypothetical protein